MVQQTEVKNFHLKHTSETGDLKLRFRSAAPAVVRGGMEGLGRNASGVLGEVVFWTSNQGATYRRYTPSGRMYVELYVDLSGN